MPSEKPSLPEAATIVTPLAASAAKALAVTLPVQGKAAASLWAPPSPRLRLMIRTFNSGCASSQSSAASISEKEPWPPAPSTLSATRSAPGATPTRAPRVEVGAVGRDDPGHRRAVEVVVHRDRRPD